MPKKLILNTVSKVQVPSPKSFQVLTLDLTFGLDFGLDFGLGLSLDNYMAVRKCITVYSVLAFKI